MLICWWIFSFIFCFWHSFLVLVAVFLFAKASPKRGKAEDSGPAGGLQNLHGLQRCRKDFTER